MLYKIARKITTDYLDGLSFADRTGGLVRMVNDHRKTEKTYPIEVNQDKVLGDLQYLRRLVPHSDLTSLMYWEMGSDPSVVEDHNKYDIFEAQLKLVVWFNYQKVDPDMYDPSYLIAEIKSTIPFKIGSFDCLVAVTCSLAGEERNDGSIFTQYSYNAAESQYYTYPYDYFVLTFDIGYRVVRDCEEENLSSLPVDPVLITMTGNTAKTVSLYGVSGREYQIYGYADDLTVLIDRALHEYSGEWQDYTVTPKVGTDSLFRLDYGREYLRGIDMPSQNVTSVVIPDDDAIRLEYVDLSGNAITSESVLIALIDHLYDTEVNDGELDISGGTNACISDATALSQITDMINNRGWAITYNMNCWDHQMVIGNVSGLAYGYSVSLGFGSLTPDTVSGTQCVTLSATVASNNCIIGFAGNAQIGASTQIDVEYGGYGTVSHSWTGTYYLAADAALTAFLQANDGNTIGVNTTVI